MEVALPNALNYGGQSQVPNDTQSIQYVVRPSNGSSFTAGSQIQLELPCQNFLVGSTMSIRYKLTPTAGSAGNVFLRGTPVYAPLQRLQTLFNGQVKEDINEYGMIMTYLINSQYDSAMKNGLVSYGYSSNDTTTPFVGSTTETVIQDGTLITAGSGISLSAPLPCCLSMVDGDKFVPMDAFSSVRFNITLDTVANLFAPALAANNTTLNQTTAEIIACTDYTITNFELVFNVCTFNQEIKDMLLGQGETLILKTQSFNNIARSLSPSASGSNDLAFEHRLRSIKSLHALFSNNHAAYNPNGKFESRDLTSGSGLIQFMVGGVAYPQLGLDTQNNKSYVLIENKKTWNALGTTEFNPSISSIEFSRVDTTVSSLIAPAKFYVSTPTERVLSSNYLMSGVNTQNTPVSLRLNIGTATSANSLYNIYCIAIYDMLIELDTATRQVNTIV
jgi:hypothetical protein